MGRLLALDLDPLVTGKLRVFFEPANLEETDTSEKLLYFCYSDAHTGP